jgi:hypothetical protein
VLKLIKWIIWGDKNPVQHNVVGLSIHTTYVTSKAQVMEIVVKPDPQNPATFLVHANGVKVGRVWVEDNGLSLGVSDLISPIKFVN